MTYTILNVEQAAKRFQGYNFSFFDAKNSRKNVVKIAETAAILTELHLDKLPDDNTVAYIFMENLTVLGNIWNEETDFGVALIAFKNIHAENITVGGQEVYIQGNLDVNKLLCGSYNHGSMTVRGDVKAQYILNDDYTFLFEKNVDAVVLNDVKSGYYKINNWKESLDNAHVFKPSNLNYWDVLNPSVHDVYHDNFDFTALIKLINSDEQLFMSNKEKVNQLNFNSLFLIELFNELHLKEGVNQFGFGIKTIDLMLNFNKELNSYFLEIKLKNELFKYTLINDNFAINQTINLLTTNVLSKNLDINEDLKSYYRAIILLNKTKELIREFNAKKIKILKATELIMSKLFPEEFKILYPSVKMLFEAPIAYFLDNKTHFDALKINYLDWSFQKHALLFMLKSLDLAIVINGKEYISTALNDLTDWFKKRDFDIETDWKSRGLYLKRRIEYFSKDVLIVNEICEEKKIPLSILDYSLWLNDRFIVFFPIKNTDKELFSEWLTMMELTK